MLIISICNEQDRIDSLREKSFSKQRELSGQSGWGVRTTASITVIGIWLSEALAANATLNILVFFS